MSNHLTADLTVDVTADLTVDVTADLTTDFTVDIAALACFQRRARARSAQLQQLETDLASSRSAAQVVVSELSNVLLRSPTPVGRTALGLLGASSNGLVGQVLEAFSIDSVVVDVPFIDTGSISPASIIPAPIDIAPIERALVDLAWTMAEGLDALRLARAQATALALRPIVGPTLGSWVASSAADAEAQLANRHLAPLLVNALAVAADPLVPDTDNGDPGGWPTDRRTEAFRGPAGPPIDRGRAAIIAGLTDTTRHDLIHDDEFQLIDHGDDRFTIVLPGVIDLTNPDPGLHDHHESLRDMQIAVRSAASTDVADNRYAQAVVEYVERTVPAGSSVALIGHSFGADTAIDLAADPTFNGQRVTVTHVVAAAYHSGPQLADLQTSTEASADVVATEILVLQNQRDLAVLVEHVGHQETVSPRTPADQVTRSSTLTRATAATSTPSTPIVRRFDGGWAGFGHDPSNYTDYLHTVVDDDLDAFFEGWAEAGYTAPGTKRSVDISAMN